MRAPLVMCTAVASVGAAAASWLVTRNQLRHWGTTLEEQHKRLPGDLLVPVPNSQYTMAVTIDATPAEVWPWLVQMGIDRGGLYSNLFIENVIFRLGVTNADRIHPEWQDLKVGDHIWFTPEGYAAPRFGPVVARMDPHEALVMRFGELGEPVLGTWQFILEPAEGGRTRLLLRGRGSAGEALTSKAMDRVLEPGYLIMNRAMLLGIKARAERSGRTDDAHDATETRTPVREEMPEPVEISPQLVASAAAAGE